jgi:cytochrome P450
MKRMTADARELAATFDLEKLPAEFYANPYPTYRALREHAPVKRLPNGSYFLTRYDDLVAAYKHTTIFSSDKKKEFAPKYGDSLLYEHHTTSLVFNDPPAHTRVRRLIMGALSPRAIAGMEPDLVKLVDHLLDAIAAKGKVDLIEDFASAIPIEVIGNLLDVPHDEREPLRDWSLAILGALEPVISPDVFARGNQAVKDFLSYLEGLVARRRARPGNPDRDVLTRLIQGEDSGERLTEKELLHNCIFLLNAGHETTTNLIGNGLVALQAHAGEKRRLIEDPILIKTAVEEMLRFESSNQLGNRMTVEAVELGGIAMPAGTPVARPTAIPPISSIPNVSISAARRTGISPSAPARINAPEWPWRGWRVRLRSRASLHVFRITCWTASPCAAAGCASADTSACRARWARTASLFYELNCRRY